MESAKMPAPGKKIVINKMLYVLIAMVAIMSASREYFFTLSNLSDILSQVAIYGIAALGMTFVIISGELDLSIGSCMALSGIVMAQFGHIVGYWVSIPLALIAMLLIGILHAFLITRLRISSFVTTLATMTILKGVALLVQKTPTPLNNPGLQHIGSGNIGIIPIIFIIFVAYMLILDFVLKNTRFGRNTYAVGGNADAATKAGITVIKNKYMVFIIGSFSAGIAGILLSAKLGAASPLYAANAGLSSLSAIVIGGTSMSGGKGGVLNTLIGVLIMGIIQNAIAQFGVTSFYIDMINGLVLIMVVSIDSFLRTRKALV